MNRKETLDLIKSLLKFGSEGVKEDFADAKLEDGTIVRVDADDFAEGLELLVIAEDGTMSPAPDGEHKLEDGRVLVVEGGVITSISVAEEQEEEEKEKEIEEEMSEETEEESEESEEETEESEEEESEETEEEVEEEVEGVNLEDKVNQLEALINELIENQKAVVEGQVEMSKIVENFAKYTPATTDKEDTKSVSTFSEIKKEKQSAFESNLESLRKMRTKKIIN